MTKRSTRRRRQQPVPGRTPKREWLNAPVFLILGAGLVVFLAFQHSFDLAVIAGIAMGVSGWLWGRGRSGDAPRAPRRRPATRRR